MPTIPWLRCGQTAPIRQEIAISVRETRFPQSSLHPEMVAEALANRMTLPAAVGILEMQRSISTIGPDGYFNSSIHTPGNSGNIPGARINMIGIYYPPCYHGVRLMDASSSHPCGAIPSDAPTGLQNGCVAPESRVALFPEGLPCRCRGAGGRPPADAPSGRNACRRGGDRRTDEHLTMPAAGDGGGTSAAMLSLP